MEKRVCHLEAVFLLLPFSVLLLTLLPLATLLRNHITQILLKLITLLLSSLLFLGLLISPSNRLRIQSIFLKLARVESNVNVAGLLPL
jgi:hypothetical protein